MGRSNANHAGLTVAVSLRFLSPPAWLQPLPSFPEAERHVARASRIIELGYPRIDVPWYAAA